MSYLCFKFRNLCFEVRNSMFRLSFRICYYVDHVLFVCDLGMPFLCTCSPFLYFGCRFVSFEIPFLSFWIQQLFSIFGNQMFVFEIHFTSLLKSIVLFFNQITIFETKKHFRNCLALLDVLDCLRTCYSA